MLQKPNTVFVGKQTYVVQQAPGAANALTVGDIVVVNPANGNVSAIADLTSAVSEIQIGYVKAIGTTTADATIIKSAPIKRNKINSITPNGTCAYVAPTLATSTIDWTNVTLVAGHRYVIRCIYRDIYEHPGQFTHSYEVISAAGETIDTIAAKFMASINAHTGRRVNATVDAANDLLILTARDVTANGFGTQGKEAITPYSQVQLATVVYKTNPIAAVSSKEQVAGLTITIVESKPGRGNVYIVRDREQAALAYKGITYRTEWPVIKPELNVDLSKTYDTLVIEFTADYQSPDNQYVKSTGLAAEVYIEAGAGAEALRDGIAAWMVA